MERVWRIKNSLDNRGTATEGAEILKHLLASRGITTKEDTEAFLNPKNVELISPYAFCDMERAVKRIKSAIEAKEHVLIWGDFDADGVSATALLYKVFAQLGANFSHFIPNRECHGHGLNSKELVKFIAKKKLKLVITVDCGISDNSIISMLNGLKVDTIITDHHRAPEVLPSAFAILNPRAEGAIKNEVEISKIQSLCDLAGVGVAYKLSEALIQEFKLEKTGLKNELLPLVALGTIGDVVPLLGENRTLTALGLDAINNDSNKGIKKVFEEASKGKGQIGAVDVAFILAPRINAVGRLSTPDEAFELLTNENEIVLSTVVQKLNHYNSIRQTLCDEIYSQCLEKINEGSGIESENAIILFDEGWHIGVIGIVATKLVEKFNKPVFLATVNGEKEGRCSIRGLEPYNIYEILKENEKLFLGFGGHSLAGGFSFDATESGNFEKIKTEILKIIDETTIEESPQNVLNIDFEFNSADEINFELIKNLTQLEPCGQENRQPIFCLKGAKLLDFKQIGKDKNHLKFECEKGNGETLSCVWWRKADFSAPIGGEIDIAFYLGKNEFNGNTTIQLEIVDLKGEITVNKAQEQPPGHPLQIQNVFKMAKYAHNKLGGQINLKKMAMAAGVETRDIRATLEFLVETGVIERIGENKIAVLKNSFL